MTVKTSERTILRVKDLTEQPPSRFALLPGGLDRVILAVEGFTVEGDVLTAYGPEGLSGGPLFSAPVGNGFIILDRRLCDTETVESSIRRMHADELDAERLAEELHPGGEPPKGPKKGGKLSILHPPAAQLESPDFASDKPLPGQYL